MRTMKKMLSILFVSIFLTAPVFAQDYSKMTIDELVEMRNEITKEIQSRVGSINTSVGAGYYVGGQDIIPGNYVFTCESPTTRVVVYKDLADFENDKKISESLVTFTNNCGFSIKEGEVVVFNDGFGTITSVDADWVPAE